MSAPSRRKASVVKPASLLALLLGKSRLNCPIRGISSLQRQWRHKAGHCPFRHSGAKRRAYSARNRTMKYLARLAPPLAVVGALTMIPMTTSTLAASEADTMKELDTFMDVFNQVRASYV